MGRKNHFFTGPQSRDGQPVPFQSRFAESDTPLARDLRREIRELISGARRYVLQPFVPREDIPDPRYRALARTSPDRMAVIIAAAASGMNGAERTA
mgnify:CR=1 FL=1